MKWKNDEYTVRIEKTTGSIPPPPPGIENDIWNQFMMDLPLKDSNGNKVRVVVHNKRMEHITKDVTVFIKWNNGFWYPCQNLNTWQKAFKMAKTIVETIS